MQQELLMPIGASRRQIIWGALSLIAIVAGGCGWPVPESVYVPMNDGTEIAVDLWLPQDMPNEGGVPTIVRFTRYWRDYELAAQVPPAIGRYLQNGWWLNEAGYAVALVDVRGTGASFGRSLAPWAPPEVADYRSVVSWLAGQPWSNGRVGALGVSYDGVAADWVGALDHPAVYAVLPAYTYSDVYLDVSHPGGLLNKHFTQAWGEVSARMDRNDISFLDIVIDANPIGPLAQFANLAYSYLAGVRPVLSAEQHLGDAVQDHLNNPHVYEAVRGIKFRDDPFDGVTVDAISPLLGAKDQTRSAALRHVVGWLDAGTARGALRAFNTLEADYHVVLIAPHTHTGNYASDPYDFGPAQRTDGTAVILGIWQALPYFDAFLRGDGQRERRVYYYTYVENQWKQTATWPPENFETQRWYFGPQRTLTPDAPTATTGADEYVVDFSASTGSHNRWFSGLAGVPIRYVNRAEQDQRLLIYETPPTAADLELTGHPVVSLKVVSTHRDGAFYVYLEDVAPDGTVVYLTEGQLRGVHRQVSDETPPAAVFGPYHTYRRADADPLVPGAVAEITFDLLPISTIIREGHRIRVALAGHDAETFVRVPSDGEPVWQVQRNAEWASWIDLPLRERNDLTWPEETVAGDVAPAPVPASPACPLVAVIILLVPLTLLPARRHRRI